MLRYAGWPGPLADYFFLTRLVLLASHFGDVNTTVFGVLGIFGLGLVYDLSFLSYAALPVALYLTVCNILATSMA